MRAKPPFVKFGRAETAEKSMNLRRKNFAYDSEDVFSKQKIKRETTERYTGGKTFINQLNAGAVVVELPTTDSGDVLSSRQAERLSMMSPNGT